MIDTPAAQRARALRRYNVYPSARLQRSGVRFVNDYGLWKACCDDWLIIALLVGGVAVLGVGAFAAGIGVDKVWHCLAEDSCSDDSSSDDGDHHGEWRGHHRGRDDCCWDREVVCCRVRHNDGGHDGGHHDGGRDDCCDGGRKDDCCDGGAKDDGCDDVCGGGWGWGRGRGRGDNARGGWRSRQGWGH